MLAFGCSARYAASSGGERIAVCTDALMSVAEICVTGTFTVVMSYSESAASSSILSTTASRTVSCCYATFLRFR